MPGRSEQRRIEKEKAPRDRSEKQRDAPRPEKKRGPARPEEEKTPRRRPEKRPDEERDPRTIRASDEPADEDRLAVEELGGESEYSMHEAQHDERGSTHRKARDRHTREQLTYTPEPDELGRRYLEEATQAPATDTGEEEEPVLLPHEPD